MFSTRILVLILLSAILCRHCTVCNETGDEKKIKKKEPSILIVTLIRNKAHTLPYYFSYLENQDYPKDRISFWFKSDHNEDDTITVADAWINNTNHLYHSITFHHEGAPARRRGEMNPFHWTDKRYLAVIEMKEEAFAFGRQMLCDYIMFLDADVFLTDPKTLKYLVGLNLPIVSPLLKTESLYANFWGAMRENYFYKRTDDYMRIKKHEKIGEFKVPLVNSAVLIDLNNPKSKYLTHDKTVLINHEINGSDNYDGPNDDVIVLAKSAEYAGLQMYISNSHPFGYMMAPLEHESSLEADKSQLTNVLVMIIHETDELVLKESVRYYTPQPRMSNMGLSKIFVINLDRRKEKFSHLKKVANAIGIEIERIPAVDGNTLTTEDLYKKGIRVLPAYENMFEKRPMRLGEVGCFLSHYNAWKQVIDSRLDEVLIMEDDIMFEHYFKQMTSAALSEARSLVKDFDIIYLGRHALGKDGPSLKGSKLLRQPGPSLTLTAYVLSNRGARKLINSKPLEKMVPVDEYVGIMYDKHSNDMYKKYFPKRELIAYTMDPPIVKPVKEKGDIGWISDTENSNDIEDIELLYPEVKSKDEL